MGIPKEQVKLEASFVRNFDFEEFKFSCLLFYIGSFFKINIVESDYAELVTIGSTMNFVKKRLQSN
jgi:acyl carrier protein